MARMVPVSLALLLALSPPAGAADFVRGLEIQGVRAANAWGAPKLDSTMATLSNGGFLVLAPVGLACLADRRAGTEVFYILGSEAVAYAGVQLLKPLFRRQRPYQAYADLRTPAGPDDSYSFPSVHAAVSFAAASEIGNWRPAWGIPAYTLAALVSYSRMYNGLHYPTDLLVGAAWGIGASKLVRGLEALPSAELRLVPFYGGWGLGIRMPF